MHARPMQFNCTVKSTDRTNCALDYATESLLRFSRLLYLEFVHCGYCVYTVDGGGLKNY